MEKNWGDTPSATLKAAKRMKDQKKSKSKLSDFHELINQLQIHI